MNTDFKVISVVLSLFITVNYFIDKEHKKQTDIVIGQLQYNIAQKDTIIDLLEQISFKKDSVCRVKHFNTPTNER